MNINALNEIISHYKENFNKHRPQELYKWEAVKYFQDNWDAQSINFESMLKKALGKQINLLTQYEYMGLIALVKEHPEAVRKMFVQLFDEDGLSVVEKTNRFLSDAKLLSKCADGNALKHNQTERSVSVYIFLNSPDRNFLYNRVGKFERFANIVEYKEYPNSTGLEKLQSYYKMCEQVRDYILEDRNLLDMSSTSISSEIEKYYQDTDYNLLTDDLIFIGSWHEKDQGWWPSEEEYHPGIDKEKWKELWSDNTIFTDTGKRVISCFIDFNNGATCTQVSLKYGETPGYYNAASSSLAKRIHAELNCDLCKDEEDVSYYFPILFFGKRAGKDIEGSYIWKLRPELREALEEMGIEPPLSNTERFKKLLEWFVTQLKINNGIIEGRVTAGKGYKGDSIREAYKEWNSYPGLVYDLECTIQAGFQKNTRANYIHHDRINIVANFINIGDKSDVEGLQIHINPIDIDLDPKRDLMRKTIAELGLFDEEPPNNALIEFFEEYMDEIKKSMPDEPPKPSPPKGAVMEEKNIILFGPPGTGKTYNTVRYAVAIIESDKKTLEEIFDEDYKSVRNRYIDYKEKGLIAFTTFHQSYGYEEFIEGIRPVMASNEDTGDNKNIEYEIRPGIFKEFCDKAGTPIGKSSNENFGFGKNPRVWKISLNSRTDRNLKQFCFNNNCARIGKYDVEEIITDTTNFNVSGGTVVSRFHNSIKIGDIVVSPKSNSTIDAIGVVTGDAEWLVDDERGDIDDYHRSLPVNWIASNISYDILSVNGNKKMVPPAVTPLHITPNDAINIINKVTNQQHIVETDVSNRVFIIDEINRGNISKIFGELITLIEPSKRIGAKEEIRSELPYSQQNFGVPDNVYIVGTMNTADRSIAMMDTALRRRFEFVEMRPDSEEIRKRNLVVFGIDVANLLDIMNMRIQALHDREHTIGHSFFLELENDCTLEKLAQIFENKIIPLLQEYFYDDYEKIRLVLGDNQKLDNKEHQFIIRDEVDRSLFGNVGDEIIEDAVVYKINSDSFMKVKAYEFLT